MCVCFFLGGICTTCTRCWHLPVQTRLSLCLSVFLSLSLSAYLSLSVCVCLYVSRGALCMRVCVNTCVPTWMWTYVRRSAVWRRVCPCRSVSLYVCLCISRCVPVYAAVSVWVCRMDKIRNVVFMGMGEPLDNYTHVVSSIK